MAHHTLTAEEWHRQSGRDLQAAEHLLQGDFPAHATVLAHLAVEKALKALYRDRTGQAPPATHDLRVLAKRLGLDRGADGWSADLQAALDDLSDTTLLALYAPDRPFGHPVSDAADTAQDVARERAAAARMITAWIDRRL